MKMDVYICKQEFKGVSFESYSADTEEDEYLIKLLLDYLEEKDMRCLNVRVMLLQLQTDGMELFIKTHLLNTIRTQT